MTCIDGQTHAISTLWWLDVCDWFCNGVKGRRKEGGGGGGGCDLVLMVHDYNRSNVVCS